MIKEINLKIQNSNTPVIQVLLKNEKTKLIAIGLKTGIELADHKAPSSAKIIVLQGTINYISNSNNLILSHLDEHNIPLEETHKVIGITNAIFLLIIYYE